MSKKTNLKTISYLLFAAVILGLLIFSLRGRFVSPSQTTEKITITTSFYPLAFFTQEIGGDRVSVINLTPPGAEPHEYELTSTDIIAIQNSLELIILGNLEPWAAKLKADLAAKQIPVLEVGSNLMSLEAENEEGEVVADPHIWLSPRLAQKMVTVISQSLVSLDRDGLAIYQANAQSLILKLQALDQKYKAGLSECKTKNFVTSHEAFGYLARDYGLTQLAISGLSPEAEPSLQELARIADMARENQIKYIFFESLVSPELSETVAREVGAQTLVLNPLEGLTPEEIASGKSYITEMERNLDQLRLALECQ